MLRADLGGAYLSVISSGRPHRVKPMAQLIGPATWYVSDGEFESYLGNDCQPVESGGLCESRNAALGDAFEVGVPCIQLSDDLKRIRFAEGGEGGFKVAVERMRCQLTQSRFFKLAGVAPTDNDFYYDAKKPVSHLGFIVGDMIMVLPTDLRFDENMYLKEDYDYTLQHVTTYGGVVRCNDLLFSFTHRTNSGGAVEHRTADREQEAIGYLKDKWGSFVRDNPRRENEILLRWPRAIKERVG